MKGYICRSKKTSSILISIGSKPPTTSKQKNGRQWYTYIPGWFHTMSIRAFKKAFGFSIKPGTHKRINIVIEGES